MGMTLTVSTTVVLKVVAMVKKMVRTMFDIGGWVVIIAVAMVVMCP